MTEIRFDDLARVRLQLQTMCEKHIPDVADFSLGPAQEQHLYFDIHGAPETGVAQKTIRNLTSTATCIRSLRRAGRELESNLESAIAKFATKALQKSHKQWVSDKSAGVYCRVRALPVIIDELDATTVKGNPKFGEHLQHIFQQLIDYPNRESVGEHGAKYGDTPGEQDGYPANAYHTYWASLLLDKLEEKNFDLGAWAKGNNTAIATLHALMNGFARRVIGREIALHATNSAQLDTDQLVWATAHFMRKEARKRLGPRDRDLIDAALNNIFETQATNGSWPRFAPLFHYSASGNAHSYMPEALAELFEAILVSEDRHGMALLRHHAKHLVKCIEFLSDSRINSSSGGRKGWTSGHRTNQSPHDPESWATANVYDFLQCARQLFGHWTKEQAIKELPKHKTKRDSRKVALEKLEQRGSTWALAPCTKTVGERLKSMFITEGPTETSDVLVDPDGKVLEEDQACSVILYGPPGASKTTMSRALANSIDWDYIEIHASDFVAEGLPNVQKTADDIFNRLLHLNRVVILFDEIDELVRSRDKEGDAFGRFLTTSMLPKLASLWDSKQVIYIVATNHLEFFDSAIVRSGRFDARLFAGPSDWASKEIEIRKQLAKFRDPKNPDASKFSITGVNEADISKDWEDLEKKIKPALTKWKGQKVGEGRDHEFYHASVPIVDQHAIGCLLPLRWDEMSEVAYHLYISEKKWDYTAADLKEAVRKFSPYRFCDAALFDSFEKRHHQGWDYGKRGATL